MIIEHFEDYLRERHMEDYCGTSDDAPDMFERFCEEIGWEELMQHADEWRNKQIKFYSEEMREMVLEELESKNYDR